MILAPVYYGCPLLCSQLLNGLTRRLKPLSLEAGKDFDVVAFSINPEETPELAQSKKTAVSGALRPARDRVGLALPDGRAGVDRGPGRGDRVPLHVQSRRPSSSPTPRAWSS